MCVLAAVPEDVRLAGWAAGLCDDAEVAAGLCVVFAAAAGGEVVLVFLLGGAATQHAGTANASKISVKTRFMGFNLNLITT